MREGPLGPNNRPIRAPDYNLEDDEDEDANSNNEYLETNDKAKGYILTAIEQQVRDNNAIVAEKIVQKSKKKSAEFAEGSFVILAILAKIRLSIEPKRLLCCVIKRFRNQFTLTFKFGRLNGS